MRPRWWKASILRTRRRWSPRAGRFREPHPGARMTSSLFRRVRAGAILAIVVVPACSLLQRETGRGPLSDRDVAAIFLAANNTDVSYAQVALAPGRTSNTDVIAFANRMLSDHGGLNKSAIELFSSTG